MGIFDIRPLESRDRHWVSPFLEEHWGSVNMVTKGKVYKADDLPGFIALSENRPLGLLTFRLDGDECEITSLDSLKNGIGIGTALLESVRKVAKENGCRRLFLITTNDNTHALRFYQRRGYVLAAVYCDSVIKARWLKPEIPLTGNDGIPIRDEIELETILSDVLEEVLP